MEPELQAAHPEIRTYSGADADGSSIRLDITPMGFHAFVRRPDGVTLADGPRIQPGPRGPRAQRIRRGMTLREVSAEARVSLGYISEIERGQKEASFELLASLCSALDIPLSHGAPRCPMGGRRGSRSRHRAGHDRGRFACWWRRIPRSGGRGLGRLTDADKFERIGFERCASDQKGASFSAIVGAATFLVCFSSQAFRETDPGRSQVPGSPSMRGRPPLFSCERLRP